MYEQVLIKKTVYGAGENQILCGDGSSLPSEIMTKAGQIQCVYLDPPFMTGKVFRRKRPWGEKGWRRGNPSLDLPGYMDRFSDEETYLEMLSRMISVSWELMRPEGVLYLHLDWRMTGQARMMCDQVFGKERFLNEIIWSYESGGRSKRTFSRKHDNILLYAKGKNYQFDITRVPLPRGENRQNHMARKVDADGRMYSSIMSGGKEYRYYDDDPVYPGDVWSDISFLQQRDPERTGFVTQKPLKLLERLLKPVVSGGDWVADLCCGSGTTLVAAEKLGCRYIGTDQNPEMMAISLARVKTDDLTVTSDTAMDDKCIYTRFDPETGALRLEGIHLTGELYPEEAQGMDLIESWETGRIEGTVFYSEKRFQRSFQYPALTEHTGTGRGRMPDLLITDAAGIRRAYQWREA